MKIKLSLIILLFSMTASLSAAQQQTEAASKVLALERSEVVYDWRANAFIGNKRNFRHWKIADNHGIANLRLPAFGAEISVTFSV